MLYNEVGKLFKLYPPAYRASSANGLYKESTYEFLSGDRWPAAEWERDLYLIVAERRPVVDQDKKHLMLLGSDGSIGWAIRNEGWVL